MRVERRSSVKNAFWPQIKGLNPLHDRTLTAAIKGGLADEVLSRAQEKFPVLRLRGVQSLRFPHSSTSRAQRMANFRASPKRSPLFGIRSSRAPRDNSVAYRAPRMKRWRQSGSAAFRQKNFQRDVPFRMGVASFPNDSNAASPSFPSSS